MASIYKNGKNYYLSVRYNGKRLAKSLGTDDERVAESLQPLVEKELLLELMGIKKPTQNLPFSELYIKYVESQKHWSKSTYLLNESILRLHNQGQPLPKNQTSKAIYTRHINQCYRWGLKNNLIKDAALISGSEIGLARHRTLTKSEIKIMFNNIQDKDFNSFVRFAYYTGARSGEIRSISIDNVLDSHLVVNGKTGERLVKLNEQAKEIIHGKHEVWKYSKSYVSQQFKKEVRRLGIKNARFHDLRRTFGLNLIKQGMSIYKVSKLLGHKSVRTTEQHYAPLLTVDIEDFTL